MRHNFMTFNAMYLPIKCNNNKNMNIFNKVVSFVSKFVHNDAHTCCEFFQMTPTGALIFTLFIPPPPSKYVLQKCVY